MEQGNAKAINIGRRLHTPTQNDWLYQGAKEMRFQNEIAACRPGRCLGVGAFALLAGEFDCIAPAFHHSFLVSSSTWCLECLACTFFLPYHTSSTRQVPAHSFAGILAVHSFTAPPFAEDERHTEVLQRLTDFTDSLYTVLDSKSVSQKLHLRTSESGPRLALSHSTNDIHTRP